MQFLVGQVANRRTRRIEVGLWLKETQAGLGCGPQTVCPVLTQTENLSCGQAVFDFVVNPGALNEPMRSSVRRNPDAPVSRLNQSSGPVKAPAQCQPVLAVELPHPVLRSTPDFAIGG